MIVLKPAIWVKSLSDFYLLDLELQGLCKQYQIFNNIIFLQENSQDLLRISHLDYIQNKKTHYSQFVEEFNSLNNYSFHGLVPFKGKFYPRIARAIINNFALNEKDWIIDPFCGSGTTNLEAQLMGINSVGLDISFYSYFISKLKLELINLNHRKMNFTTEEIKSIFSSINKGEFKIDNELMNSLLLFTFLDVKDMQSRLRVKKGLFYLFKTKLEKIVDSIKKTKEILDLNNIFPGQALILNENALNCKKIFKKKFDAIITSPPYFFSLNYLNRNKFFNQYFGINEFHEEKHQLGRFTSNYYTTYEKSFQFELGKALEAFNEIIKEKGKLAIIMGNSNFKGKVIDNCHYILKKGKDLGWKKIRFFTNPILGKNTKNIFHEKIILFQREN